MQAFHCPNSAHSWSCKVDLRVRKLPTALGSRIFYRPLEKQYESFEFLTFKNHDMHKANTKVHSNIRINQQHTSNNCTGSQAKFRFGDLPLELQLQILEFVILPGHIYLQIYIKRWDYGCRTIERLYRTVAKASNIDDPIPRWLQRLDRLHMRCSSKCSKQVCDKLKDQQPGFGLMAMGKFLYQKGHPVFYGQNTFHLSPGPLNLSTFYFSRIRPRHRSLIKSLAVTFTIADLIVEAFKEVEYHLKQLMRDRNIKFFIEMSQQEQVRIWTTCSLTVLESIWRQKLEWLLTWSPVLERVTLSGPTRDFIVSRADMAALFEDPIHKLWKPLECELGRFLQRSIQAARQQLLTAFERRGKWRCFSYDDGYTPDVHLWKLDIDDVKEWLNGLGHGAGRTPGPGWMALLSS